MKTMALAQPIVYIVEPFGGSVRWHNPNLPHIYFDDAGLTRGDGVFESLLIRGGRALNLERHFERFERSAQALDLPEPIKRSWVEATQLAVEGFGDGEAKCTWTLTRGRASTGIPSAWVVVAGLDEEIYRQRECGVRVQLRARDWTAPTTVPAKTVNYAATMACLRQARAEGFDDVIFTDPKSDLILEGATSTVVTFKGNKIRTPASPEILPGTTQAALFAHADSCGYRCKAKPMTAQDLLEADSVWLVSSVRLAVRVRRLGEDKLPAPDNQAEIAALIDAALAPPAES